jgi:hypothetical protein
MRFEFNGGNQQLNIPAAIWLPIVASIKLKATKNCAALESKSSITAGMYHWKLPQMTECADVTKIGVRAPRVPMIGRAKNCW